MDTVTVRLAGQPSTSSWEEDSDEESKSSGSATSQGEPIHARQHGRNRLVRINGILVYRMANIKMVDCARGRHVYSVDYLTTIVTLEYLESLWEEFQILDDIKLVMLGPNDLPSCPPPSHITLLAEIFRAGLHLPFHPF